MHSGPELVQIYARLRADCEALGHALGQREHNADRWIAATALRLAVPLVSNDGIFRARRAAAACHQRPRGRRRARIVVAPGQGKAKGTAENSSKQKLQIRKACTSRTAGCGHMIVRQADDPVYPCHRQACLEAKRYAACSATPPTPGACCSGSRRGPSPPTWRAPSKPHPSTRHSYRPAHLRYGSSPCSWTGSKRSAH